MTRLMYTSIWILVACSLARPGRAGIPAPSSQPHDGRTPNSRIRNFGGGYFGEWGEESGLPFYEYTADQVNDPACRSNHTDPDLRDPTEHFFHIGNDRLVALASNYGTVQIRQDEGGPKLLNDKWPAYHQYGGGLGFLNEGKSFLFGTQYQGNAGTSRHSERLSQHSDSSPPYDSFRRRFGVGFVEKTITKGSLELLHRVTAPHGSDTVLLSRTTITNRSSKPRVLTYTEVWGGMMRHLDMFAGMVPPSSPFRDRRAFVNSHYTYSASVNAGIMTLARRWTGLSEEDKRAFDRDQGWLKQQSESNPWIGPVQERMPEGASLWDHNPPTSFLAPLGQGRAVTFASDCASYFGNGDAGRPEGVTSTISPNLSPSPSPKDSCMLVQQTVTVPAGGAVTIGMLVGYHVPPTPRGSDHAHTQIRALVKKYSSEPPGETEARTAAAWRDEAIGVGVSGEEHSWVSREVAWNYYYTVAQFTYDDYFGEYVLDQGTRYRYDIGYEAAHRDPLQHILPIIASRPDLAKSVLRLSLKQMQPLDSPPFMEPFANIPWALHGHGLLAPLALRPSDLEVYMIWAASEYVLMTQDYGFLDEELPLYGDIKAKERLYSVRELLQRCWDYLVLHTGRGRHGLVRLGSSDWSDTITFDRAPNSAFNTTNFWAIEREGESVLTAAMVAYISMRYAAVLQQDGLESTAASVRAYGASQREALRAHAFNGRWLKRAWFTESIGWIGDLDDQLNLEPHAWALMAGVFSRDEAQRVVEEIDERLLQPSPIGAMQLEKGYSIDPSAPPGYQENGGVWPALNHPLVMALSGINVSMAWQEWIENTLAVQSEIYPMIWGGTWSSADASNSILAKPPFAPGEPTGPEFPVLCTHRHAWPLFSAATLMGVSAVEGGLRVTLRSPDSEPFDGDGYHYTSPLAFIEVKWYQRRACGGYRPLGDRKFMVAVDFSAALLPLGEVKGNANGKGYSREGMMVPGEHAVVFSHLHGPVEWCVYW